MRKTRAESQQTRQHLLDAALEVFWRTGVSRASLLEIAQEAGVTRGALYWHFKNKEDLFDALFVQMCAQVYDQLREDVLQQSPDALAHLRNTLLGIFHTISTDERQQKFCNILFLKCECTERNRSVSDLFEQYSHQHIELVRNALYICHLQRKLPENLDIDLAALFLNSSIRGLLHLWIENPAQFSLPSVAEQILDNNLNTLKGGRAFLKTG